MKKALITLYLEENMLKDSQKELLNYISNLEKLEINILLICKKIVNIEEIKGYNIGNMMVLEIDEFETIHANSYVDLIVTEFRDTQCEMLILDNSIFSKDIASILAERLDGNLVNEAIEIIEDRDSFRITKNIYGGNYQEIYTYVDGIVIITVKNNIFNGLKKERKKSELTLKKVKLRNERKLKIVSISEIDKKDFIPVTHATIVIAGGYALRKKEDISMLEELATVLNGSVGGTRAIVDKGYMRRSQQIGQSGKKISPNLLINFGISGQRQFTAGFTGAKTVISVNKDREATIFKHSDFGIVGDIYEIIPEMIKMFKRLR